MKELVFATQNKNKVKEIQSKLGAEFQVKSLLDLNFREELQEDHDTLQENALQKVRFVHGKFGQNAFADDTGLEIEYLNGEPGVYSARYAGEAKSFDDNMNLVLKKLEGVDKRKARFRTVIALIFQDKEYLFEGICTGVITSSKQGAEGFGYDPIFKPDGFDRTFAEMTLEEKNQISHRAIAVQKLIQFLRGL